MQHSSLPVLKDMTAQIKEFVHKVAKERGLEVAKYDNIVNFDPVNFDAQAVACVEHSAKEMGYSYEKLISHTGEYYFQTK